MRRPKTYDPAKGKGGGRQKMWDTLRRTAGRPFSIGELSQVSGSAETSVRSYLHVLVAHDYVERKEDGMFVLLKNTGPRAPSVNMAEGTLYDWNIHEPLTGAELRSLWAATGLSVKDWVQQAGLFDAANQATLNAAAHRIIEMFDGKRPVSPAVEEKAKAFTQDNTKIDGLGDSEERARDA